MGEATRQKHYSNISVIQNSVGRPYPYILARRTDLHMTDSPPMTKPAERIFAYLDTIAASDMAVYTSGIRIAKALYMSQSTTYRHLKTLTEQERIEHKPQIGYRIRRFAPNVECTDGLVKWLRQTEEGSPEREYLDQAIVASILRRPDVLVPMVCGALKDAGLCAGNGSQQ